MVFAAIDWPRFCRNTFGYWKRKKLRLPNRLRKKLTAVSASTVDRILKATKKLQEKVRIGARVKKRYDIAKTPFRKIVDFCVLTGENKTRIQEVYSSLNSVDLKRRINKLTDKLTKTLRYKIRDTVNA